MTQAVRYHPPAARRAVGWSALSLGALLVSCGSTQSSEPSAAASGGSAGSSGAPGGGTGGRATTLPVCADQPIGWSTGVFPAPYCTPAEVTSVGTLFKTSPGVWMIMLESAPGAECTGSRINVSVDGPVEPAFVEGEQVMVELEGFDGSVDQLSMLLAIRDMQGSLLVGTFLHAVEQWAGLGAADTLGFDARFEERCELRDPGCNEAVVLYDAVVADDEGEQRLQPWQRTQLILGAASYELDYHGAIDYRGLTRNDCFPLTTGQRASFTVVRSP